MQNSSGRLWFLAGLDTSEFMRQAESLKKELGNIASVAESQSKRIRTAMTNAAIGSGKLSENINAATGEVNVLTRTVTQSGSGMESVFGRLTKAAAGFAGVFSAQSIISSIVRVRGEFQQLEKSFLTLTGSAEETEMIMGQLADTAATTPFGLTELSQAATRLMAYGLETEKVNETLIRLGDIAAGLRIPINDLAYLYGTTMVQGRLYTEDFNQFVGRGIPIIGELAKQFGVAEGAVKGLVEEGKVGFPEIEKAIIDLTAEGGRFGGLMESQSQTITGQISNLQDSLDMMFNELGQKSEGVISGAISAVSSLVENYEKVGRIIADLVVAYGTYKAALITITALQKAHSAVLRQAVVEMTAAAAAGQSLSKAQAMAAARTKLLKTAMASLNKTMMLNPYVAAAAAIAALGLAIYKYNRYVDQAKNAEEAHVVAMERQRLAYEDQAAAINSVISALQDETLARVQQMSAIQGLDTEYQAIIEKYLDEEGHITDLISLQKELNSLRAAKQIQGDKDLLQYYQDMAQRASQYKTEIEMFGSLTLSKVNGTSQRFNEFSNNARNDNAPRFSIANATRLREVEDFYTNLANRQKEIVDRNDQNSFIASLSEKSKEELEELKAQYEQEGRELTMMERERYDAIVNALTQRTGKIEVKNRQYWEDLKKESESALAALSSEDAAGARGDALKKQIKEYSERLAAYNVGSSKEAKESEEAAAAELADVRRRIADEEYELQRKSTDDRLELIELEKSRALQSLQEELDTARSIYEQIGIPTDEIESQYRRLADITAKSYDADASKERSDRAERQREEFEAVLQEYETYQQARRRIEEKYEEDRRRLTNEDGSLKEGVVQENLDEISRREQEEIASVSETFAMRDAAFESWSNSLAGKTRDALELMLSEAVEQLSILEATEGADPDAVAKATAAVSELQKKLKSSDTETEKSSASWTDLNGVLQGSAEIFSELGEQIPGVAGQLLSGIGSIATSAASMSAAITGIATAASAAEKATAILAVISVALQVLSIIPNTINANIEATEEATQAAWEYAEALEEVQRNSRLEKYDTIFDKDSLGEFQETVKLYEQLADKLKSQKASYFSSQGEVTDYFADNSLWDTVNKVKDQYVTADFRSGWQKFWGTGDDNVHTFNLSDYINDDGTVKVAELQAMYDAYAGGMDESSKRLVESLLNDGKAMEEYLESMRNYISGLFDDISGNIADSMITAFEETGDAANATFDDIKNDIAKTFAKDAIVNMLHKNVFTDEAQSKMMEMIQNGDSDGALDYLDVLVSQAERLAPAINETLKGLDVAVSDDASERTTASKGIAQASQESVDELNGRATAIQSHTYSISTDMRTLVNTSSLMLDRLTAIEYNTARLEAIEKGVSRMRSDINTIMVKGIHIR